MKIAITGHTSGVGKAIYEYFLSHGHEVIGMSRTTGFDLNDIERVISVAKKCDVFINNTYFGNSQTELVKRLCQSCKVITFGSIAADYVRELDSDYARDKKELQDTCAELSLLPNTRLLYLKLTFLEDAVSSSVKLTYPQVIETITYWLSNPCFSRLDYDWKLTDEIKNNMKNNYQANI